MTAKKLLPLLLCLALILSSSAVFAKGGFRNDSGVIKADLDVNFQDPNADPAEWEDLFVQIEKLEKFTF